MGNKMGKAFREGSCDDLSVLDAFSKSLTNNTDKKIDSEAGVSKLFLQRTR